MAASAPPASGDSHQYPWLYDERRRFCTPCVLHEQLHGHPQALRSMTGNRFWPPDQVQTRAHDACVRVVQRRVAAAAAQAEQSDDSHEEGRRAVKRPLDSDSSAADAADAPPLPRQSPLRTSVQSLEEAKQVWQQQDFAILRGLDGAAEVARRVAADSPIQQQDQAAMASFEADVESLCRRACDTVGFDHSGLWFLKPKRLTSQPGEGEEDVHWDAAFAYDTPPNTVTFLLQCTEGDGVDTIALPTFCARERIPATRPRDCVAFGSARMRTKASRREQLQDAIPLLEKQHFHIIPARVGDVTLFRHSVPHHDTRNKSNGDRVVLTAMLSASPQPVRDMRSFHRHFIANAFGPDSLEYAQALLAGKEAGSMDPQRFLDEKSWREAVQTLEKHGLLRLYCGEGVQPQWTNSAEAQAATEQREEKAQCKEEASGATPGADIAAAAASSAVAAATSDVQVKRE